jgi:uncharacterized protein YjbI with pentapeptide repeats
MMSPGEFYSRIEAGDRDFQGADLRRLNLVGDLQGCDFRGADLSNVCGDDAIFVGSNFEGANLSGSTFMRADLRSCNMVRCDLTSVDFRLARLSDTVFDGSTFCRTSFQ